MSGDSFTKKSGWLGGGIEMHERRKRRWWWEREREREKYRERLSAAVTVSVTNSRRALTHTHTRKLNVCVSECFCCCVSTGADGAPIIGALRENKKGETQWRRLFSIRNLFSLLYNIKNHLIWFLIRIDRDNFLKIIIKSCRDVFILFSFRFELTFNKTGPVAQYRYWFRNVRALVFSSC